LNESDVKTIWVGTKMYTNVQKKLFTSCEDGILNAVIAITLPFNRLPLNTPLLCHDLLFPGSC
jgi:hypothetical protein